MGEGVERVAEEREEKKEAGTVVEGAGLQVELPFLCLPVCIQKKVGVGLSSKDVDMDDDVSSYEWRKLFLGKQRSEYSKRHYPSCFLPLLSRGWGRRRRV